MWEAGELACPPSLMTGSFDRGIELRCETPPNCPRFIREGWFTQSSVFGFSGDADEF
jgi:hypothetical protein